MAVSSGHQQAASPTMSLLSEQGIVIPIAHEYSYGAAVDDQGIRRVVES